MPKIIFKAEMRIPRQIVLPMAVARAADAPRTLVIQERELEAAEAIADYLAGRYPRLVEVETDDELQKLTVAQLKERAEEQGIDLGGAKKHADIVEVIRKAEAEANEPADSPDDLDKLTIAQLRAHAEEQGIDLGDAQKHDDIVVVIRDAKAQANERAEGSPDTETETSTTDTDAKSQAQSDQA